MSRHYTPDKHYTKCIPTSKQTGDFPSLSETALRDALQPYGIAVTPELTRAVRRYVELLLLWNKKVNLTSVTRPEYILSRHFGESMLAGTLIPLDRGRLADVGSGAGFPSLPLKLLSPELNVLLIEPNMKKCAFLAEVVRSLNLSGVEIARARIEDIHPSPGSFDFITCRAVGNFDRFLAWSKKAITSQGHILLWLGTDDANLVSEKTGWRWEKQARIPGSDRSVLLIGSPVSA